MDHNDATSYYKRATAANGINGGVKRNRSACDPQCAALIAAYPGMKPRRASRWRATTADIEIAQFMDDHARGSAPTDVPAPCCGVRNLRRARRKGRSVDAAVVVVVIGLITLYQARKTERALEALRDLSSPRALVIRDGVEIASPGAKSCAAI